MCALRATAHDRRASEQGDWEIGVRVGTPVTGVSSVSRFFAGFGLSPGGSGAARRSAAASLRKRFPPNARPPFVPAHRASTKAGSSLSRMSAR